MGAECARFWNDYRTDTCERRTKLGRIPFSQMVDIICMVSSAL